MEVCSDNYLVDAKGRTQVVPFTWAERWPTDLQLVAAGFERECAAMREALIDYVADDIRDGNPAEAPSDLRYVGIWAHMLVMSRSEATEAVDRWIAEAKEGTP